MGRMVSSMKLYWPRITKPLGSEPSHGTDQPYGVGCPLWVSGRARNKNVCEQDWAYPLLPWILQPPVKNYGHCPSFRCPKWRHKVGVPFPQACWLCPPPRTGFPLGSTLEDALESLRELALMRNVSDGKRALDAHCKSRGARVLKQCRSLYSGRDAAIIHEFKHPDLHALALDLLLP